MALDSGDWLATPAPLNTEKHGPNARFTGDNSVVERWEPEQDPYCVCYTSRPLPPGQVWQTTVLNTTTTEWPVGLVSGCVLVFNMPYMCICTYAYMYVNMFEPQYNESTEV